MTQMLLSSLDRLRGNSRAFGWVGFYGIVIAAWVVLVLMARDMPAFGTASFTAPGLWEALCLSAANAEYPALFGMWALMSIAMMMPTMIPAIRVFNDLGHAGGAPVQAQAALMGGYLGIWLAFSAVAAGWQMLLSQFALLAPDGSSVSPWLTAGLLALAGGYQFSRLKEACLSRCRAPLLFFMERWSSGTLAAGRMGVALGVHCLGCCWALMALGFVGGTMNLIWMGLATVFMVLEKLPDVGRGLTRPTGWLLLGSAVVVAMRAAGIF